MKQMRKCNDNSALYGLNLCIWYTRLGQPTSCCISFESEELHDNRVSVDMAGERKLLRTHIWNMEVLWAQVFYAGCHIGGNSKNNLT